MPVIHEGPPPSHRCEPPAIQFGLNGVRLTNLGVGTIFECSTCGRGAVVQPGSRDYNVWRGRSRRWLRRRKRKLWIS